MNELLANGIVIICVLAAALMGGMAWWMEIGSGKKDQTSIDKNKKLEETTDTEKKI